LAGRTFGEMIAQELEARIRPDQADKRYDPVRNRRDSFTFHADRELVREEFNRIWDKQKELGGELAALLTDELRGSLDDPSRDEVWRHRGVVFGQRRTYWSASALLRCDLEPTDERCPKADMVAQEFLIVETVNNIRLRRQGELGQPLTPEQRHRVIERLCREKTSSIAQVRRALGIDKRTLAKQNLPEDAYELNLGADPDRKPNTNWFYREMVLGVFGDAKWQAMSREQHEAVNRAILKFDPAEPNHAERLRRVAVEAWQLDDPQVGSLLEAWRSRPKRENRLNLSRRAIRNLLPYMNEFDREKNRWPTQIEARQQFAEDAHNGATPEQRVRYAVQTTDVLRNLLRSSLRRDPVQVERLVGAALKRRGTGASAPHDEEHRLTLAIGELLARRGLNRARRRFLEKHPDLLPPAPEMANPVVRKAIHEVRRHLNEYLRRFGRAPDRVVVELAREARQSKKVRDAQLARNRKRAAIKDGIREQFGLSRRTKRQQEQAIDRVLLCRQQREVCPYSGKTITEQMAADGDQVESDHIVPKSRSNEKGPSNQVLCFRDANRGKGNKTPKEWLGADSEDFAAIEQRLRHLKEGESPEQYFSPKDCKRKWALLHADAPSTQEFLNSQLTDTAYAARQVVAYVRDALYGGETEGERHVFTTKGQYTAMLRRDWGLLESELDRQWNRAAENVPEDAEHGQRGVARREKDRRDHLHHAVDAAVIAFCWGETIQKIAHDARLQEEMKGKLGQWPSREPIPPPRPWKGNTGFRNAVLEALERVVVSHRPVKRKLVGALHKESLYGPVLGSPHRFTRRIWIWRKAQEHLKPAHLRVPDGWDELSAQLDAQNLSKSAKRRIRRRLAALQDPPPGKTGIVRDRELRDQLRRCLRRNGLDPDDFTPQEIKYLAAEGRVRQSNGVPVKSAVLLWTISDPVRVPRRIWDLTIKKPDERMDRVYDSQNNHHVEIRENLRTGKWQGKVIRAIDAARRVRPAKSPDGTRPEPLPPVDRSDGPATRFVMSLAEAETIHACRKDRAREQPGAVDYYVVAKIDKLRNGARIHFVPHWDARKARGEGKRDEWEVTPADLKGCGPEEGSPPYKVRVSPLGEVRRIDD